MTEIATAMNRLVSVDGLHQTNLSGVQIFKASEYTPREPLCYQQGLLFVGQGAKRVYLDDRVYEYNPENYLALSVPLPVECETCATPDEPVILMSVDIELSTLRQIYHEVHEYSESQPRVADLAPGLFVGKTDASIQDVLLRLLTALQSPLEASLLGPGLVRELLFRVITSDAPPPLELLVQQHTELAQIDKVLNEIHETPAKEFSVELLAKQVHMSRSTFHRCFKARTCSSPIQYIKKVRLNRAHTLLSQEACRVEETAHFVGYESATQFSREFKRYFGCAPSAVRA